MSERRARSCVGGDRATARRRDPMTGGGMHARGEDPAGVGVFTTLIDEGGETPSHFGSFGSLAHQLTPHANGISIGRAIQKDRKDTNSEPVSCLFDANLDG